MFCEAVKEMTSLLLNIDVERIDTMSCKRQWHTYDKVPEQNYFQRKEVYVGS